MFGKKRNSTPDHRPAAPSAGLFLGALPIDPVAAGDGMAEEFELIADTVARLLEAHQRGTIRADQVAANLAMLVVTDTHGVSWTVGATSRGWYRRTPGLPWAASPAPDSSVEPVTTPPVIDLDALTVEATGAQPARLPTPVVDDLSFGEPVTDPADDTELLTPELLELLGPISTTGPLDSLAPPALTPVDQPVTDPFGPVPDGLTGDGLGGASRHIRSSAAPDLVDLDLDLDTLLGVPAVTNDSADGPVDDLPSGFGSDSDNNPFDSSADRIDGDPDDGFFDLRRADN